MVSFQTKDLKLSYTNISSIRLLSQKSHAKGELYPLNKQFHNTHLYPSWSSSCHTLRVPWFSRRRHHTWPGGRATKSRSCLAPGSWSVWRSRSRAGDCDTDPCSATSGSVGGAPPRGTCDTPGVTDRPERWKGATKEARRRFTILFYLEKSFFQSKQKTACISGLAKNWSEIINVWMNEWMNEWIYGWVNYWMNG